MSKRDYELITFDISKAFLPTTSFTDKQISDDIAFLVGPRKDGIIKEHQLTPIPIHENRYEAIKIDNDESDEAEDQSFHPHLTYQTNMQKVSKKKKSKSPIKQQQSLTNHEDDFTDDGFQKSPI
jgi:hypothetical protein